TPMTKACHQLFQVNKNPSDADIEQAFKLQVQMNCSQKMQELIISNEWVNLWSTSHSIILEYFRNHRNQFASSEEVRSWKNSERVEKARYDLWNKMDDNNPDSLFIIKAIQKAFTKEELQNQDNIKFGITEVLMFLDPTYDQLEDDIIDHDSDNESIDSNDQESDSENAGIDNS
ncbi:3308_t:CDS:2, partial [Funneliformis geosporum]